MSDDVVLKVWEQQELLRCGELTVYGAPSLFSCGSRLVLNFNSVRVVFLHGMRH